MLLHELLDATAARFAGADALSHAGRTLTYAELQQRSCALAGALHELGVRRGDRVVVHLPNRPEVIEVALASSRIGAIFVPANALLKPRQLAHIVRDSGARVLVGSAHSLPALCDSLERARSVETLLLCDSMSAPSVSTRGTTVLLLEQLRASAQPFVCDAIDLDPAALLYTSGSTGAPKGVVVSHRNLVSGALSVSRYLGNASDDRILAVLPLSFDYGFSQVTTAFAVGACAVLASYSLPLPLLQDAARERITGLAGVPTMWASLAGQDWPASLRESLRYITSSGGVLPVSVIQRLRAQLQRTRLFCMYGLTEAFRSTYLPPEQLDTRAGSIGKAIPNQEILVLRPDGSRCEPGEPGELVHRGSLVALGYWNDPDLTRKRFRPLRSAISAVVREDVCVWSGDLVRSDAEGYLYFLGRTDEMIKTSGHRVSPTEVEEVVCEVPLIHECAALGFPDDVLGQRIVVAMVAVGQQREALADAVRQHCRMQLPSYMVPSEYLFLPQLPRNVNGKVDRAAVTALVEQTRDDASVARTSCARSAG